VVGNSDFAGSQDIRTHLLGLVRQIFENRQRPVFRPAAGRYFDNVPLSVAVFRGVRSRFAPGGVRASKGDSGNN
jgi:hypothetical protein